MSNDAPLQHDEEGRGVRLRAYYSVLNDAPGFAEALESLARELPSGRLSARAFQRDVLGLVEGFRECWALPRDRGVRDVVRSVNASCSLGLPLELRLLSVSYWSPQVGSVEAQEVLAVGEDAVLVARKAVPLIFPNSGIPFSYDPSVRSASWLTGQADAIANQVRDSILQQGRALEQAARAGGWKRVSPRYRGTSRERELRKHATRLYRRAVLKWQYAEILQQELDDEPLDADSASESAVRSTVNDWAKRLQVLLDR